MRTRFWKLSALMLALMLALTGCSLIEIDQEMEMAEVVATVGETKITKGDVIDVYNYQVDYMNYLYSYYGMGTLTQTDIDGIKDDVIEYYIELELLKQKAAELGLSDFSDESFAEADAKAVEEFEGMITEHAAHVSTEGMTDEAAREAVIAHLASEGTTLATIQKTYRDIEIADLVREHVIANVEVTEEEIQAAYESKVASDEQTYSGSTYLYETYQTYGDTITWNPEGYRTVKHILFKLSDEQTTALSELNAKLLDVEAGITALNTAEITATASPEATADPEALPTKTIDELNAEKAELEKQIEDKKAEILASFKEKTDAVYARLEAGEAFDTLMAELGEDPGMQSEPSMTKGYYVSAASTVWDTNFRDAAMAIEEVGGVSEPVLSGSGVHIVYYNSDVIPGAVDIETVREVLTEEALTAKQDEAYTAQYEEWKKGASIKKYPKVLG